MSAEQRMRELRLRYLASLADKRLELCSLWNQARTRQAHSLEALRQRVHKLAGSAPVYGLGSVGFAARALDEALLEDRSEEELTRLFATLKRELQASEAGTRNE